MSELWIAAVVTVGGGIIAGMGAEKKDKNDKKFQSGQSAQEARQNAQQTGYETALEDYYNTKNRFEKQRGLDQYRQFSTTDQFAPGMNDQGGRIASPVAPDYNSFAPTVPEQAAGPQKKKKKLTGLLAHDLGLF